MPPNSYKSRHAACFECGLRKFKSGPALSKLSAPFTSQYPSQSPHAYQTAKRVVEEGEIRIAEIDKAIKRLHARKKQIARVVNHHRLFLAVAPRLPDEILLTIFEQVCGCFRDEEFMDLFNNQVVAPWRIAAVCQRWRRVALSNACSHLWAQVYLGGAILDKGRAELLSRLQLLQTQVSRAGAFPLRLHLHITSSAHEDDSAMRSPLVGLAIRRLLATILPKCQTVALEGEVPVFWHIFTDDTPTSLERLRELEIREDSWLTKHARGRLRSTYAPILQALSVSAIDITSIPTSWLPRLSSLIIVECVTRVRDVLTVLKSAATIQELTIGHMFWDEDDSGNSGTTLASELQDTIGTIHLPFLHTASLAFQGLPENPIGPLDVDTRQILQNHLRAPALSTIKFDDIQYIEELEAARSFLRASGCESRITSLELHKSSNDDAASISGGIVSLLGELPSLERLRLTAFVHESEEGLDYWVEIDEILMALEWPSDSDHPPSTTPNPQNPNMNHAADLRSMKICPKLEEFGASFMIMDSTILRSMLESRRVFSDQASHASHPSQLEAVSIEDPKFTDILGDGDSSDAWAQLPWLVEMEEKGWIRRRDFRKPM